MKIYTCCDERRRDAVRAQHTLEGVDYNGIDYLEVMDAHTLRLYFIHALKHGVLGAENVHITGGERIRDVSVASAALHGKILTVKVNKPGDASIYTLNLKADQNQLWLDQPLSSIDFTFNLPTDTIDCAAEVLCVPEMQPIPEIDYLAKDFTSFRQLMLDRLAQLMPDWQERSAADIGVMLVEVLAYVADHLSYQQDVIATESYLGTARRRISARRHARLVDYLINEGCNARVWVQVQVNNDVVSSTQDTQLLTHIPGLGQPVLSPSSSLYSQALSVQPTVFEPMESIYELFVKHNQISLYTWGARECCLSKGSTRTTLRDHFPNLKQGDVLIFKEMVDPRTGAEVDAEPTHRHAVRLTKVLLDVDPLGTWPHDQSGTQDDPSNLGKVIAEFEVVEEDRLLVEEARMTNIASGERIEKQEEYVEEETHSVIHRYLIEKPDHSLLIVEVRMREDDRYVEIHQLEAGYVIQEQHREETYEEDITQQPTDKLPRMTRPTEEMARDETTQQFSAQQPSAQDKGREIEEGGSKRTRIVHSYRIRREPDYHVDITKIEWGYEDALPFPLCISGYTDYEHGHRYIDNVSIALGNIVLADHGMHMSYKQDPTLLMPNIVPDSTMNWATPSNGQTCEQAQTTQVPPRFYPQLKYTPLTFAAPYTEGDLTLSASAIMQFEANTAVPWISLQSDLLTKEGKVITGTNTNWSPQRDLLESRATDPDFTVEVEADGSAFLRFGDDRHGMRPDPQTRFLATYRVGNGRVGNIGHDALGHIVSDNPQLQGAVSAVTNPLPAQGGVDPESIEDIRQNAAGSFTLSERGITPQDYKDIVERDFKHQVHRANAILRWTGSWYTVFLAVERVGGIPVDDIFKQWLRKQLEKYRMAGTDLVIVAPVYVPLEISMTFTVQPGYLPGNVKTALLKVFSNQQWPDGERGVFYPANYTFGSPVYLNPLYKAASEVPGVASVKITTFQRLGMTSTGQAQGTIPTESGVLTMEWQEIPILENNPQHPERGIFSMTVEMQNVEAQYVRS